MRTAGITPSALSPALRALLNAEGDDTRSSSALRLHRQSHALRSQQSESTVVLSRKGGPRPTGSTELKRSGRRQRRKACRARTQSPEIAAVV